MAETYDRSAIMFDAHRQYRLMRPLGWSFARCLSFAWSKAKARRAGGVAKTAFTPNKETIAAMRAARRGDLVIVGSVDELFASLNH